MSMEGQRFYPGEGASAAQILLLAEEYCRSADVLRSAGRNGCVISWAPYRLVAIHAIELYLNAYLVAAGCRAVEIRAMQHDTAARARSAAVTNLQLRKRTSAHLQALSDNREYLVARYDPAPATVSQLNRLQATLTEVAQKVSSAIAAAGVCIADSGGTDRSFSAPIVAARCSRAMPKPVGRKGTITG